VVNDDIAHQTAARSLWKMTQNSHSSTTSTTSNIHNLAVNKRKRARHWSTREENTHPVRNRLSRGSVKLICCVCHNNIVLRNILLYVTLIWSTWTLMRYWHGETNVLPPQWVAMRKFNNAFPLDAQSNKHALLGDRNEKTQQCISSWWCECLCAVAIL